MRKARGFSGRTYERGDRESIEGLMQENHKKRRESRDHSAVIMRNAREYRSAEGNSLDHTVQRETDGCANPTHLADRALGTATMTVVALLTIVTTLPFRILPARMRMAVAAIIAAVMVPRFFRRLMLMELEEALEEEHHHKPKHKRKHDAVKRAVQQSVRESARRGHGGGFKRDDHAVGEEMEESNSKHHSANKAECELQPPMAELHHRSDGSACERSDTDERAVDDEQRGRRERARSVRLVSQNRQECHEGGEDSGNARTPRSRERFEPSAPVSLQRVGRPVSDVPVQWAYNKQGPHCGPCVFEVEWMRIELTTSSMRPRRSPN